MSAMIDNLIESGMMDKWISTENYPTIEHILDLHRSTPEEYRTLKRQVERVLKCRVKITHDMPHIII